MEDAIVLAGCMRENSNIPEALLAYEQKRIPRTTRIVHQSRRMGRLVQLENPILIRARNSMLSSIPSRILVERLNWIVGHEVLPQ
jgi:2-polyprenyl-6-methoxyphenol hydroxylase-like FAD-dependent oxidoreductase